MWKNSIARCGRALRRAATSRNPVLVRALAVAPVLAATLSLKSGVLLAAVMLPELLALYLLRAAFYRRLPAWLRGPVFFALAGVMIAPLWAAAKRLAPNVTAAAGIYLPLLAAGAFAFAVTVPALPPAALLPVGRGRAAARRAGRALLAAAGDGLGFALAAVLISGIREAAGAGTLYDRALPGLAKLSFPFILQPPGAFLLLGFLLAAARAVRLRRRRRAGEETRREP